MCAFRAGAGKCSGACSLHTCSIHTHAPHSLHWLLRRSQMPAPPHSLHVILPLWRWCAASCAPRLPLNQPLRASAPAPPTAAASSGDAARSSLLPACSPSLAFSSPLTGRFARSHALIRWRIKHAAKLRTRTPSWSPRNLRRLSNKALGCREPENPRTLENVDQEQTCGGGGRAPGRRV